MKEVILPVSITVDVCRHHDLLIVARHSGDQLVVEGYEPEYLNDIGEITSIDVTGNAGARVYSWAGVLWLAFRDGEDRGFLIRLDNGEVLQLMPFWNPQRPFAFGDGVLAWMASPTVAYVLPLGHPVTSIDPSVRWFPGSRVGGSQFFGYNVATGLSHIGTSGVVPWEELRTLRPYGAGFTQVGPYILGEDFGDHGLVGEIDGHAGRLRLWPEFPMRDPRIALLDDDSAAVIAWSGGGKPARMAVVSPADLVSSPEPVPPLPEPIPIPEPPPMPDISRFLEDRTQLVHRVKNDYPDLKGGAIVDQVAHRLNREHGVTIFGRKARQANGSNPNEDVLTIQRDPRDFSKKAMVDILVDGGGRDEPTWHVIPEAEEAGNGFWRPPVNEDLDDISEPVPRPQPGDVPHAYDGGDNDTGVCDICGEPRDASIHELSPPSEPTLGSIDAAVDARLEAALAPMRAEMARLLKAITERPDPDPVDFPSRIALKSVHGRYVSADADGRLVADRDDVGAWETFDVESQDRG